MTRFLRNIKKINNRNLYSEGDERLYTYQRFLSHYFSRNVSFNLFNGKKIDSVMLVMVRFKYFQEGPKVSLLQQNLNLGSANYEYFSFALYFYNLF